MKYALPAALIFLSLSASPAKADSWADFNKLVGRYYLIDKAEKASISCNIGSSVMDELLDKVPFLADDLEADLRRFSVSVRPDGNIAFQTPRMRVNLGSPEASAYLSRILQLTVLSLQHAIQCLLEGLMTPKRERFLNLVVTPKGEETVLSFDYKLENYPPHKVDVTISGDTDLATETSPAGTFESATKNIPLDGKLAPSKSIMRRTAAGKTNVQDAVVGAAAITGVALTGSEAERVRAAVAKITGGTVEMKYQKVGGTYFPSRITAAVTLADLPEPRKLVISFNNCTGG